MTDTVREDLRNSTEEGKNKYIDFRSKRLLDKSERISATIHRNNFKNMASLSESTSIKSTKQVVKEISLNERVIVG